MHVALVAKDTGRNDTFAAPSVIRQVSVRFAAGLAAKIANKRARVSAKRDLIRRSGLGEQSARGRATGSEKRKSQHRCPHHRDTTRARCNRPK